MDDWPRTSSVSHTKPESQLNHMGTHKGVPERIAEAADGDGRGASTCSKAVDMMRHPQRIAGSAMNVVRRNPSINGTTELNGCSNYNIQEIAGCSLFRSQFDHIGPKIKNKHSSEYIEASEYNQNLTGPARCTGSGNIPQIQCRNINLGSYPTSSSFISSNRTDVKLPPTLFEFYVRSEEGINLFVDLNSTPSDWIKNLKNEVCIHPENLNDKSCALNNELKSLEDSDEEMKASSLENTMVDMKNKGDPIRTKSSLSLIVREGNHVRVDQPDTADVSRSFAVIQTNTPVDKLSLTEENNQMISSLCKPSSEVHNLMDLCTCETVTLGLDVPNSSQIKSTGNHVTGSKSDGLKCLDLLEHHTKSGSTCPGNTETGSVGASSVSHVRRLPFSSEVIETIKPITGIHMNGSSSCPGCSTSSGSTDMTLSEVASLCEDMSISPIQYGGAPDLDNLTHDLQNQIRSSAICGLDLNKCLNPLSECPEEQRRSGLPNEIESSESSQIDMLATSCKRSCSSESEGLQSKRQHRHSEDQSSHNNPAMKNLRGAKNLAREVLPRRSMRLVTK